jgi:hypothetical protein
MFDHLGTIRTGERPSTPTSTLKATRRSHPEQPWEFGHGAHMIGRGGTRTTHEEINKREIIYHYNFVFIKAKRKKKENNAPPFHN